MKWTLTAAFLIALPTFAHIQKGEHQGKTETGTICSLQAGDQSFLNNQAHPLNERISIQVGADTFLVGHPPVIDTAKPMAYFNHDLFQGVLATNTGTKALVIEMVHTSTKEGPASYTLITHNWKTGEVSKSVCANLNFVQ